MGHDSKYGRVITEHGSIPDDEPVIVFRARDAFSVPALRAYLAACQAGGSPIFHADLVGQTVNRFMDWQKSHRDEVRVPASAAHQERLEAGEA